MRYVKKDQIFYNMILKIFANNNDYLDLMGNILIDSLKEGVLFKNDVYFKII